jgi:hypothetical protein
MKSPSATNHLRHGRSWRERSSRRMPVVGYVGVGSADASAGYVAAFRKGLCETGYVERQNVTVERHSPEVCRAD